MKPELKKVSDQVIVITGPTSGIGLATARMAAHLGARLVLAARTGGALRELAEEIRSHGGQAAYAVTDVSDLQQVQDVADIAIKTFGGFDTWVNNAGVSIYGKLEDVSLEDQRKLFETNYWGVVHGSLVAADHLKQRGGALINVGSALSDRAMPIQGTYCASKHAVKGFTDALRMELEHDGAPISVTLIKPASIDTPYRQHAKNYLPNEPKNPWPVYAPEPVAEAILYAAENPTRDIYVGGASRALSLAGFVTPRGTDKVMESVMFNEQQEDRPSSSPHAGLDQPSSSLVERGGYPGHVARSSLYTKSSLHPFVAGGLIAAGLGLAYAVTRKFRSNGN
ncbi:MAG TPA: SDR family oxidoreductase [Pyrinomonadaceae bacterium]|nr:SDR family oxidoreductase [Pyrinomonadaceae bacterium]